MDGHLHFTRATLTAVWAVALLGLAVWFLLAWGGHALLSDSATWLLRWVDPWIASATWEDRLAALLAWGESLGTVALWVVWALGSAGLLLTTAFATWLYLRAQRAMATAR